MQFLGKIILISCALHLITAPPGIAKGHIALGLNAGAIDIPLDSWRAFFSHGDQATYSDGGVEPYAEATVTYLISRRQAVVFSVERLATDPSRHSVVVFRDNFGNPVGPTGESHVDWTISAVPVNLSYQLWFTSRDRLSPYLSGGIGFYFSEVEGRGVTSHPSMETVVSEGTRDGEGYGVHFDVGLRAPVTSTVGISARVRLRHSDGMAFTDESGDVAVEFTGIGYAVGIDVRAWGT